MASYKSSKEEKLDDIIGIYRDIDAITESMDVANFETFTSLLDKRELLIKSVTKLFTSLNDYRVNSQHEYNLKRDELNRLIETVIAKDKLIDSSMEISKSRVQEQMKNGVPQHRVADIYKLHSRKK